MMKFSFLNKIEKISIFTYFLFLFAISYLPLFRAFGYEFQSISGVLFIVAFPLFVQGIRPRVSLLLRRSFALQMISFSLLAVFSGLRGEICDLALSLGYFLLLPLCSAIFASILYAGLSQICKMRSMWLYYLVIFFSFSLSLWHLWSEPRITEYDPFFGFFAGSIYDESMDILLKLVIYRLGNGVLLMVFWSFCHVFQKFVERANILGRGATIQNEEPIFGETKSLSFKFSPKIGDSVAIILFSLSSLLYFQYQSIQQRYGIQVDRDFVQSQLSDVIETPHFRIYYQRLDQRDDWGKFLAFEHERVYRQLVLSFGFPLSKLPVSSYIYPDAEMKGQLMGGARTSVSKVWLNEMHISGIVPGGSLLKHELAHIFAAEFGQRPLKLAGGLIPRMGWVEGIAVAAEWPLNEGNPHRWASEIFEWDKNFRIIDIFSASGFWSQSSRKAYIMAGSFTRWIWDYYGFSAVRSLSRGESFETIMGMSKEVAENKWREFLASAYASDRAFGGMSRRYFDRKSIFERRCARSRSSEIEGLRKMLEEGAFELAQKELLSLKALYSSNIGLQETWLQLWIFAQGEGLEGLELEKLKNELVGDYCWRALGLLSCAVENYETSLNSNENTESDKRRLSLKLALVSGHSQDLETSNLIFRLRPESQELGATISAAAKSQSEISRYLLFNAYFRNADFKEAALIGRDLLRKSTLPPPLRAELHIRSAEAALYLGDFITANRESIAYIIGTRALGRYERVFSLWEGFVF